MTATSAAYAAAASKYGNQAAAAILTVRHDILLMNLLPASVLYGKRNNGVAYQTA